MVNMVVMVKMARVSAGGTSGLGDGREIWCGSHATRASLGRMYGLPVPERRKELKGGGSMKRFPLDDGYERLREPSDGRPSKAGRGKKVWSIPNWRMRVHRMALQNGQSCPNTFEFRSHLVGLSPHGRVILALRGLDSRCWEARG
jgi:hypothetical protein